MEKQFQIEILTPKQTVYSRNAVSLIIPAQLGYLGVLADHAPLIAKVLPGKITIRDNSGKIETISSSGSGTIEVLKNRVTVLLDEI